MNIDPEKLKEWIDKGLINKDQASGILNYENAQPKKSWFLTGFLILGAVVIGLGLISISAANWDIIPNNVKLIVNFLILGTLAALTLQNWLKQKFIVSDLLLIAYFIASLASIGLITQVYNTTGMLYEGLMFWSLITCIAVLAGKHFFVSFFWITGFIGSLYFACYDSIIGGNIFNHDKALISLNITFLCVSCLAASKGLSAESGFTRSWRFWCVLSGLLTCIVAEIFRFDVYPYYNATHDISTKFILEIYLFLFAAYLIWQSPAYTKIQKSLIIVALCLLFIIGNLSVIGIKLSIFYACITLSIFVITALLAASLRMRKLFNICLILLGFRFLILYFQALGSLASTGIGLIIAGALILAFTIAWYKHGATIWGKIERLINDV